MIFLLLTVWKQRRAFAEVYIMQKLLIPPVGINLSPVKELPRYFSKADSFFIIPVQTPKVSVPRFGLIPFQRSRS